MGAKVAELSFPIEDVTCASCGRDDCLMYPDPGDDTGAPQTNRPSTICPGCSTPTAESYLRFATHRQGLRLKPVSIFVPARPAPIAEMQSKLDEAGDPSILEALEESWQAKDGGSDLTTDFERGDDGRLIFYDGGPRPSHALALLFDLERHLQGESTVLRWGSA
jgi:hypothetical protein